MKKRNGIATPLLPILLVMMVTGAAHALSSFGVVEDFFMNTGGGPVEDRTLRVFREEYFSAPITSTPPPALAPSVIPLPVQNAVYIEIIGGCGPHYAGTCVNGRSAPATTSSVVLKLRDGIVLRTDGTLLDVYGGLWYRVIFDEWVRYPDRLHAPLYVKEEYSERIETAAPTSLKNDTPTTTKRIVIDRSEQWLRAYDEQDTVFMEETISTGLDATPTPRGTFTIFHKTPSRYMQGPLPNISTDYYDLPGVPWNLYFTKDGGAIHGAYWHDKFGQQWSHGCVNLPVAKARELYLWAEVGTQVIIRD